jgi:acetyl esterase
MIRMAHETRRQVTNAEVPDELMRQFPVTIVEKTIPFEEGNIRAFYSYPDEMKNPDVLILNMHGGGFIRGRTPNDELFCRRMNHALSCKILDLDYKIAPDYPFPAAVHEAYRTLRWVYENASVLEIDPNRIVLMGHSAGGNLCIGAIMHSLELGTEIPELLVCEYPPLDVYTDPGEKKSMGKGVPAERARLYNLYYCDRELQKDPYCSPVYAPDEMLSGFPSARPARCGAETAVKRVPGAGHAFTVYRREGHETAFVLMGRSLRGILNLK